MKSVDGIEVGLIGCGRVSIAHMIVYANLKDVNVVAIADLDLERAKMVAKRFGVKQVFKNYRELLKLQDIDLIDICTPVSTHASIVCDAANAKRNVLLEKPMALSSNDCDKMIKASEINGTKLCVCHDQIFSPAVMRANSLVD